MTQRIVDLGLELTNGLRTWDVKPPFTCLPYMTARTFTLGFNTKLLVMEDHTGTHVDAPIHANLEGKLAKEFGNFEAPGHLLFLHPCREIPIIENLVHLDRIGRTRFRFTALPLKIREATGSPVRAIATVED